MCHDERFFCGDESFVSWEGQEKKLSISLTIRWSRKRKRWESDDAVFWNDGERKWSCCSEDGKYYYGFRSLRSLLKSYVGGLLREKAYCYSLKNPSVRYWFSKHPKQVTCKVTMHCTGPLPPELC